MWGWSGRGRSRAGTVSYVPLPACAFDCGSAKLVMIRGSLGAGLRLGEQIDSAGGAGVEGTGKLFLTSCISAGSFPRESTLSKKCKQSH